MDEVGIKSYVQTNCNKITDDGVEIKLPNGKEKYLSADMVVYAVGLTSNKEEIEKLKNAIPDIPTFVIGDCKRPAKVGEAIQEGYMAAMSIV
ncbi:hypothetical protein [Fervidibacillus halotolerans]|uniref:NAD(P)/FAD-dependent oxidoreductase n=1 Tax=Fervidibacillus halotolerans TaxID=2980027 RepID=A0A9E8M3T4_9BACI|nr:hypothetical protein [Fervidibacillus halotolerans]WAA13884.1 NAD(P)/FAD-dependent oxidoreductase [Fervidibacillus halotolerans]